MKILSASELTMECAVAGFANASIDVVDRAYACPTEAFLEGAFASALRSLQWFFKVLTWSAEANDCDDFARLAAAFAQILHFLTPNRPPATALALGELWYRRDVGGAHAINIARTDKGVQTYEPQTRSLVKLSETEKLNTFKIRF